MEPTPVTTSSRTDGFEPKWRHFSPMARVWVQNPFDDDITFQVADEYNRPFKYIMEGGKVSELPGGAIATLGVKAIVDRLILNNPEDGARMWDLAVREKYEKDVIVRLKETNPTNGVTAAGEINLTSKASDTEQTAPATPAKAPEQAFPSLNQPATPQLDALPPEAQAGIDNLVSASLPATDDVASANNAHADIEG